MYVESLRKTAIEIGYPEDHETTKWTLADYVKWFTNIIGSSKKNNPEEGSG